MARLLGLDVGTSSCKALLIDEGGRVLKEHAEAYGIDRPEPGWSEQRPEEWWAAAQACMAAIGEAPDGVGITGQMHGAVFLDADDEVIRPAILWNDQRTEAEVEEIDRLVGADMVRATTGNPPLTGFQLPKILWLRNNEPENFARVRTVLLPKDYVRFKLTGVKATDVTDASGTGAFDLTLRDWSAGILEAVSLPRELFPPAFESHALVGEADGVPVAAGAGDQAASGVGTGAIAPGVVSVSLGTSGVVFGALAAPRSDPEEAVQTFCHANLAWHAMGVMLNCGGAFAWLRELFGGEYDALAAEAERASPGCDGLTFLPYLNGERTPWNDPFARGSFSGISQSHGRAEFARAVLEGATFGLADGMAGLERVGAARSDQVRLSGGGARTALWRRLIADVFGATCATLETDQGPAFGAALLAGVGAGTFTSVDDAVAATVRVKELTHPSGQSYAEALGRYRALYPALHAWRQSAGRANGG